MPNEPTFDEELYLTRYGDVRQAVNSGLYPSGYAHYVACGKAEGRQISASVTPAVAPAVASAVTPARTASSELAGTFYQVFLQRMHTFLQPRTYFEIGTLGGDTLKLASCASISVDPVYQIHSNVLGSKPACYFFQQPSDEFFERHDPQKLLGGSIDLAFLDGMHLFEFLLRDFYNTEPFCERNSIVVLHDCLPLDEYMAVREPSDPRRQHSSRPNYWTGDVWKMIPTLRRWRPDLKLTILDAPPTGLALITNLDPGNRLLKDNYDRILEEYSEIDLGAYSLERLYREASVVSTDRFATAESFSAFRDMTRS